MRNVQVCVREISGARAREISGMRAREAVREIACQNCKIHRVRDLYSGFIKCTV